MAIGYHTGKARAEALKSELPGTGHAAIHLSLADVSTIHLAARRLEDISGRLDVLVNSAGFTTPIPHHDLGSLNDHLFGEILLANVAGSYSVASSLRADMIFGKDRACDPVARNAAAIASVYSMKV